MEGTLHKTGTLSDRTQRKYGNVAFTIIFTLFLIPASIGKALVKYRSHDNFQNIYELSLFWVAYRAPMIVLMGILFTQHRKQSVNMF